MNFIENCATNNFLEELIKSNENGHESAQLRGTLQCDDLKAAD